MASIIRIKRSSVSGNPSTLAAGELAYSALTDNGSNGGDRLYIGIGTETAGNAANHIVIGGKYFTDMVSAATSSNTASTIVKRDGSGNFSAGTITAALSGNASTADALSTARTISLSGDITGSASFDGSANISISTTIAANSIALGTDTTGNYVATIADAGNGNLTVSGSGSETAAVTIDLANTTVTAGSYGSSSAIPTFTVDAQGRLTAAGTAAISTTLGTAGDSGTGSVALGSQTLTISGGTGISTSASSQSVTITNTGVTSIAGTTNQVTASAGTGAVTLSLPQDIHSGAAPSFAGMSLSGNLAMGTNSITGLADPVNAQDAATKAYVDASRSGLDVKQSVRVATTANITLSNTQTIDGVSLSVGDRVLVKDQSTASQNGIYVVASGAWSRSTDADEPAEINPGMFFFVEEGSSYADSGWVMTADGAITVGTSSITFAQFSGAGQIVAGNALTKTGNTLDVAVAASGGIEIVSDALQLKSSLAGAGLTYGSGVLDIGAGTGITVNADSIQISATYAGQTSITTLGTITTGTWNGSAIGNAYLANSAITVNGTSISLGSSGTITANTTNAVTFNSTGGAAAGTTFNGSIARTVDYSTVGAAPAAGSSSIVTVGTISSGTWNGTAIGTVYGGTGLTSYSTGDILYASGSNTLTKLAAATDGQVLQLSSGVPAWGDIDGGTY